MATLVKLGKPDESRSQLDGRGEEASEKHALDPLRRTGLKKAELYGMVVNVCIHANNLLMFCEGTQLSLKIEYKDQPVELCYSS